MDPRAALTSLGTRIDSWRSTKLFFAITLPLALVFLATGTWAPPYTVDGMTNALTAWRIGTAGTVYLDEYSELTGEQYPGNLLWLVQSGGRTVSKYPPGTAALAAPAYFVAQSEASVVSGQFVKYQTRELERIDLALPSMVPATLTAATIAAVAMGLLGLVFRPFVGTTLALLAAYLAALGTSVWSVAADFLWQHGPAVMFIALALLMMQRERHFAAGLAFGLALIVRPQVAIIAAVTGVVTALHKRSWRTLIHVGAGSAVGLAVFLGYNAAVFGAPTPIPDAAAGYYTGALQNSSLAGDVGDFVRALIDPQRGVLLWSPFLMILLPGVRQAWRSAPGWVRGSAVGGFIYLAVQMRGNTFSGGSGFFTYRYPLEMLAASAPLLLLAYRDWVAKTGPRTRLFRGAAVLSITAHLIGAVGF